MQNEKKLCLYYVNKVFLIKTLHCTPLNPAAPYTPKARSLTITVTWVFVNMSPIYGATFECSFLKFSAELDPEKWDCVFVMLGML